MDSNNKRSANWNSDQAETLIRLYIDNINLFEGKFSDTVSNAAKNAKWAKIADEVSSLGPNRTVEQCKKKMSDSKSSAKSKATKIHQSEIKTGGGSPCKEQLTALELLIVSKIPGKLFLQDRSIAIHST